MKSWLSVLIGIAVLLIVVKIFKITPPKFVEGFDVNSSEKFEHKEGDNIYDSFYASIYDYLVYSNAKDEFEISQIIKQTNPSKNSIILDVGCGTGHHVSLLENKGLHTKGIDKSHAMIKKAKENYPSLDLEVGDVLDDDLFDNNTFSHILCLYFTIYYIKDKETFFQNCYNWLNTGGYLIVHLVDKDNFDPILPSGNPLMYVSPQRYAKKRITNTKLVFDQFNYEANFDLKTNGQAQFTEKFKHKDSNKVRKHKHIMYMENIDEIVKIAMSVGFTLHGKIDMIKCQYEYQYLYIFIKGT